MLVFQKIWRALFYWNTRFEIRHFALLPTKYFSLFHIHLCYGFYNIHIFCFSFWKYVVFLTVFTYRYLRQSSLWTCVKILCYKGHQENSPRKIPIYEIAPENVHVENPTRNIPTHGFKHFAFSLLSPLSLILLKRLFCISVF